MNRRKFAVTFLAHSLSKDARRFLLVYKHTGTTHYRWIMWGRCWRRCTGCTWRDGKGRAIPLADRWCLRNVYDDTKPRWILDLNYWTTPDSAQDALSQKLFAVNTLSIVRKRFTAEDSSSQEVAKRLFKTILQSGECGLIFSVFYANKRSRKSSTTFRRWCHAFFAYQDQQLERHGALTIHIISCKAIWYECSFFAIKNQTLNQTEYLPNEFFTLLTSKLWDEINDRQVSHSRYNLLRVLRDTVGSGKCHMEINWVIYDDYTDGLRKRMWNSDIVRALRQGFGQGGSPVRSLVSEVYGKCGIYGMSRICP